MTQDEIIEMYMQVSKELCNDTEWCWAGVGEPLQMFAKLVAAKAFQDGYEKGVAVFNEAVWLEREACAKVCDEYSVTGKKIEEFDRGWLACAKNVAAAIRARGNA
jgi:hypothetical protein